MRSILIGLIVVSFLGIGCDQKTQITARRIAPKNQLSSAGQLNGKVVETFDAGGYTYIRLSTKAGKRWAAVPRSKVALGRQVAIKRAMEMKNFKSRTLGRTFKTIYFGTLSETLGEDHSPPKKIAGHVWGGKRPIHGTLDDKQVAAAHKTFRHQKQQIDQLAKAKGPAGRTIAEVYSLRETLQGKLVAVHGKVTRFNMNIMGRNWLHLQDGSGETTANNFDLTVTTKGKASVGDLLVVRGSLSVDKDFGAGYRYQIILEDATLEKQ